MNVADLLFWSIRACRQRLLESILIAVAIGLGVGVIVSVFALFQGVHEQQSSQLLRPELRTIRLAAIEDIREAFSEASGPLISIPEVLPADRVELGFDDLANLKAAFPDSFVFAEVTSRYPAETSSPEQSAEAAGPAPTEVPGPAQGPAQVQGAPMIQGGGAVLFGPPGNTVPVTATTPDFFTFRNLQVAVGELFVEADVQQGTRLVVLGHALAERLFEGEDPVGKSLYLGLAGERYDVVGVLEPAGGADGRPAIGFDAYDERAYIPVTARPSAAFSFGRVVGVNAQRFAAAAPIGAGPVAAITNLANPGSLFEIYLGVPVGANVGSALRSVREYVHHTYADTVSVYSSYEAHRRQQEQALFMGTVLTLFASIGLLIAAVNILNLMLARIYRRIRSIGMSVAVGASRRSIFRQFLMEGAVLGTAGAATGLLFSLGGVRVVSSLVGEPVQVTLAALGIGVAVALLISVAFSAYPAHQASRVHPVNALRID